MSLHFRYLGLLFVCTASKLAADSCSGSLTFAPTAFGPVQINAVAFNITPSGGTGSYAFEWAPGATPIPGFRVSAYPDVPSFVPSPNGALLGLPAAASSTVETTYSSMIRLRDLGSGLTCDKTVTLRISPIKLQGYAPNFFGVGDSVIIPMRTYGGSPPYTFAVISGSVPPGTSTLR